MAKKTRITKKPCRVTQVFRLPIELVKILNQTAKSAAITKTSLVEEAIVQYLVAPNLKK